MTNRFNISYILYTLGKALSLFFLVSMLIGYVLLPSQIDVPTVFQPVSVNAAVTPLYGSNCSSGITSDGLCIGTNGERSGCIVTSTNKTLCANVPEFAKNSTNIYYVIEGCNDTICTSGGETFSNCRNGECTVKQTAAQAATGLNTTTVVGTNPSFGDVECQASLGTSSSSEPKVNLSGCVNRATGADASFYANDFCLTYTKNNGREPVLNCRPGAISFNGSDDYVTVWDNFFDGCYYMKNSAGESVCVTDEDINEVCNNGVNLRGGLWNAIGIVGAVNATITAANIARSVSSSNNESCNATKEEFLSALRTEYGQLVTGIEGLENNVVANVDVAGCELDKLEVGQSKECNGQTITKTDNPDCPYKAQDGTCYGAEGGRVTQVDDTSKGDFGLPGVDDIFVFLQDLVSSILLLLLIFFGWIAQGLFWLISIVTLAILQINPAGASFFQVALGPWGIMVSIANIILIGGFVYVGFKYILGSGKSVKVDQFLTNVVIVGVSILFTLFACAGVINLAQGLGDVFLAGYQATSGTTRQEALVGKLVTGVAKVSYLRCGNLEVSEKGTECEKGAGEYSSGNPLEAIGVGKNLLNVLLNSKLGTRTTAMLAEAIFLVTIGYGIYVMWKAMFISLMRVVGLWLLMIVSPLALVGYLSPIPFFKKQADKWLEKFVELTIFYPVFIIGLVLIGELSGTFGTAAQAEIARLQSGTSIIFGPFINTYAQDTGIIESAVAQLAILFLVAGVSIGSMHILLKFMTTTYGAMVGAALAWGGKAIGLAASGGRLLAKGAGALGINGAEKVSNMLNSRDTKGLSNRIQQLQQRGNLTQAEQNELDNKQLQLKNLQAARAARAKKFKNARAAVNKFADSIEYFPEQFKDTFGNIKGNLKAQKEARMAGMRDRFDRKKELWARSKGAGWAFDGPNGYYNGMDADTAARKLKDPELKNELDASEQRIRNQKLQMRDLPKTENQKNVLDLANSSNGTLDSLGKSQNAFLDGLNNLKSDPTFIAKQAQSSQFGKLLGEAIATDQVDDELRELIEEVLPQFLPEDNDYKRNAARRALSKPDGIRKLDSSALLDPVIYQEYKSILEGQGKTSQQAENEVFRQAGVSSGRSSSVMSIHTKSALGDRGIDTNSTTGKQISGTMGTIQNEAAKIGYNSRAAVKHIEDIQLNGGQASIQDVIGHLDNQTASLYGASTIEQLNNLNLGQIESTTEGGKVVNAMRNAGITDQAELLAASQAAIETVIKGSNASKEVYAGHIFESVQNANDVKSKFSGITDPLYKTEISAANQILQKFQTPGATVTAADYQQLAAADVARKMVAPQVQNPEMKFQTAGGDLSYDLSAIDDQHTSTVSDAILSMTSIMTGGTGTQRAQQAQAIADKLSSSLGGTLPPDVERYIADITDDGSSLSQYLRGEALDKSNNMLRQGQAFSDPDAKINNAQQALDSAKKRRGDVISEFATSNKNSFKDIKQILS